MKTPLAILAAVLVSAASSADEPAFESVQNEFRRKALLLLSDKDVSDSDFSSKLTKLADETFGAHPGVMKKEAERRFKSLPRFHDMHLTAYQEHKSWDLRPLLPVDSGFSWLACGCDPEKLAGWAKTTFLARQLGARQLARRALLKSSWPDKVYRLGKGSFPDLAVESLGDLFVIEVEMTDAGVCLPRSVKWMKRESRPGDSASSTDGARSADP